MMKTNVLLLIIAVAMMGCKQGYVNPDDNYQTKAYVMLYDSVSGQPHQLNACHVEWIEDISPNNKLWKYNSTPRPIDNISYLLPDGTQYYAMGIKCTPALYTWDVSDVVFTKTKSLIKSFIGVDKTFFDTLTMEIVTTSPISGYAQKIWVNGKLNWNRDTCTSEYSRLTPILKIYHNIQ